MDKNIILKSRANAYSQNGEDGVLNLLFGFLGIRDGSFCEFGAWDGKHLSNTYYLLENKNWTGVYIEGDVEKYKDLEKLKPIFGDKIETIEAFVGFEGENKLDNLLKNTKLDKNFDLLSVDVDGIDYHIWEALTDYRPKLVIIEVDSGIKPKESKIAPKYPEKDNINSSFSAMCELGLRKGYHPIIHFGNIIFGDKEYLESKNFPMNQDIDSLYTPLEQIWTW